MIAKQNYRELLRHPLWQKKRLRILERDNWTCIHCRDDESELHVHHRVAYRQNIKPWEYDDSELQTLCKTCHEKLKGIRPGSAWLDDDGGWGYDGSCPWCGGGNIKDKGSFDKCMDCGERIAFW